MARALLGKKPTLDVAWLYCPKVGLPGTRKDRLMANVWKNSTSFVYPPTNWGWLNRLNACALISRRNLSVRLRRLVMAASKLLMWPSGKVLRPALERAPNPATIYRALAFCATYATV